MSHNGSNTQTRLTVSDVERKMYEKNTPIFNNSCWHTVARAITNFPMKMRDQMVMVEGKTRDGFYHVWMEVNGDVMDPHYEEICSDPVSTGGHWCDEVEGVVGQTLREGNVVEKRWKGSSVKFSSHPDDRHEQWGHRCNSGQEGAWMMRQVDTDKLVPADE